MKPIINLLLLLSPVVFLYSCNAAGETTTIVDSMAAVSPYSPIDKGKGLFAFEFNGIYFEADANTAGRITYFSLNGKNILMTKKVNAENWGTSLWPSPQSAWGWPPSKELDFNKYKGGIKDSLSIELTSEKDPLLGIVFTKNYKASPQDTSIIVTYTITNNSRTKQSIAPWEISRVAPGGLTLYPTGKGKKRNLLASLMVDKDGITWFDYDSSKMNFSSGDTPKLMHDGAEGWLAQVSGDMVLIKKFVDVSVEKTAPEEGEIEFYANPDLSYIEIEQQGEYTALDTGKSLNWEVKWYLRKLPAGVKAEVGSKELAAFIRRVVK